MSRQSKAETELVRLERDIENLEELFALVRQELVEAFGVERRELAQELSRRRRHLGRLHARRWALRKKLGVLPPRPVEPMTSEQELEDVAERLAAALLGISMKNLGKFLNDAEAEREREQRSLQREQHKEVCALYVVESTWRMALHGRWR